MQTQKARAEWRNENVPPFTLEHPEARVEMEEHAYGLEIDRAESDGCTDLAMRLRKLLDEEVSRIEREDR